MGHTVSVIVPVHNGRDLLAACLSSIPDGIETIVVDDASTDGAPELVEREFPRVRVLRNEQNRGFGATANRGLRAAGGGVRVVLNSDARLRPRALHALVGAFDDEAVGIAGPRLVFPDGSHQTSAAAFPRPGSIVTGSFLANELIRRLGIRRFPLELGLARKDHAFDRDVDWVLGTCIAIHERCLAATGGFDEDYFMYEEETDLCWRAKQAGFRVRYVADAVVEHVGGGSSGDPVQQARRFLQSERRFMARAYGPGALPRWRAARVVGGLVKLAVIALPALISRRLRVRLRWQGAVVWFALTDRQWR